MLLKSKSGYIAFGGVGVALSLVFMYLSSVVPYCKLTMLFVSSLIVGLTVAVTNNKIAVIHYILVSAISLLIVPDKINALIYCLCLGNYPLIKYCAERIKSRFIVRTIKFFLYNLYILSAFFVGNEFFNLSFFTVSIQTVVLWAAVLLLFYVYDYIYTPFVFKVYSMIKV